MDILMCKIKFVKRYESMDICRMYGVFILIFVIIVIQ